MAGILRIGMVQLRSPSIVVARECPPLRHCSAGTFSAKPNIYPSFIPPSSIPNPSDTHATPHHDRRNFHKYITYGDKILLYGDPGGDLDAFCERAQIVAYRQYKALIEAWGSFMWRKVSHQ